MSIWMQIILQPLTVRCLLPLRDPEGRTADVDLRECLQTLPSGSVFSRI